MTEQWNLLKTQNMRNLDVVTGTYTVTTLKTKNLTPKTHKADKCLSIYFIGNYITPSGKKRY